MRRSGGRRLKGDLVAKSPELGNRALTGPVDVTAGEVVAAELVVGDIVFEDVVAGD